MCFIWRHNTVKETYISLGLSLNVDWVKEGSSQAKKILQGENGEWLKKGSLGFRLDKKLFFFKNPKIYNVYRV